ncbi:hypothetical protein JG687_00016133 [Phytophthora cactorum]|uniref:Uncharacterized protein n=1 Tax=Phytophthora cactorum TaxID=29920 RepID=A0A8T1TWV0_9STRA|nr:hypothetical protein JG687_00016133 [Phytophthora cactorum]
MPSLARQDSRTDCYSFKLPVWRRRTARSRSRSIYGGLHPARTHGSGWCNTGDISVRDRGVSSGNVAGRIPGSLNCLAHVLYCESAASCRFTTGTAYSQHIAVGKHDVGLRAKVPGQLSAASPQVGGFWTTTQRPRAPLGDSQEHHSMVSS